MRASAGRAAPPAAPPGASPIIAHPDVKRMLLTMRALTRAARAICYATAVALDRARAQRRTRRRARAAHERASLLTPVAKAFSTDIGIEVASLGVQVHGGMGYIEETGAAQHYRDARIAAIYEGTNGIQAIDLVTRKLPLVRRRGGEGLHRRHAAHGRGGRCRQRSGVRLDRRAARRTRSTRSSARPRWLLGPPHDDLDTALAGATPYLRLFALAAGGALLAEEALAAARMPATAPTPPAASPSPASSRRISRSSAARPRAHRGRRRRQHQPAPSRAG